MDLFNQLTPYHWLAFGLLLLCAEMLGAAGFLIGAAVAALGMGAVVWLAPDLSLLSQLALYAVGAIAASLLYFRLFHDAQKKSARPLLNQRAKRMIGQQFELAEDIQHGSAKVQIGDTFWTVTCDQPISKGSVVKVVDTHRMSLIVTAI